MVGGGWCKLGGTGPGGWSVTGWGKEWLVLSGWESEGRVRSVPWGDGRKVMCCMGCWRKGWCTEEKGSNIERRIY